LLNGKVKVQVNKLKSFLFGLFAVPFSQLSLFLN